MNAGILGRAKQRGGRLPLHLVGLVLGLCLVVGCASTTPPGSGSSPSSAGSSDETDSQETPTANGASVSDPARPIEPLPQETLESGEAEAGLPPARPPGRPGGAPLVETVIDAPILLRVGLATDLERVLLPCCQGGVVAEVGEQVIARVDSLVVEPAAGSARPSEFRLQVAALHDEGQAAQLARRLGAQTGQPADSRFDARTGFYRVRVGSYTNRQAAEAARGRFSGMGLGTAWVVEDGGGVERPALRLLQGDVERVVPGRWLTVRVEGDDAPGRERGIRIEDRRYRGAIKVYLNDRGLLNLVNELTLEDYLRGVVPREMGPLVYPRIEALKAQAVAARTYTLRNLGEFESEGFDICATPRCQVYGGIDGEHPLSDRAVSETANQVLLYGDELVDAMYSSTCGGHTENVEVVFPLKKAPYLRGVTCFENGVDNLRGSLPSGIAFPAGLTDTLLPVAEANSSPAGLAARLEHLAALAGLAAPSDRLASLERREVQRFLFSLFDLALDANLFVSPGDAAYLVGTLGEVPGYWTDADIRRAAYLIKSGWLTGAPREPVTAQEIDALLLGLAVELQVVRKQEVQYRMLSDGELTVAGDDGLLSIELRSPLNTFRQRGARVVAGNLSLVAGDPLTLYWHGDRLIGMVQAVDPDGVAYDRSSRWHRWTRFRSDRKLRELVAERYPGLTLKSFRILQRGVSGRVGRMELEALDGRREVVEGLAVRWTFDLPDTRFTAKRLEAPGRDPGWLFSGGGWGHGVGMCQVGAFGMAGRGHDYREILSHYYTGVTLGRVKLVERR